MTENPLTEDEFGALMGVPRETMVRLRAYLELLEHWQTRINLVGSATLSDPWRRHILDSAQLYPHLRPGPTLDIGSGAGFPGLVLAILRSDPVHLVESDHRKGAFLREAIRVTSASAVVHTVRIESLDRRPFENITARAVASLDTLLGWSVPFLGAEGQCLFLKGSRVEHELTAASESWMMSIERFESRSDPDGTILKIRGLSGR